MQEMQLWMWKLSESPGGPSLMASTHCHVMVQRYRMLKPAVPISSQEVSVTFAP